MTKEKIYLFDTPLSCPPCPQRRSREDRQIEQQAIALTYGKHHD